MAIRIHVTAIRSASSCDVRAMFTDILGSGFEAVPLHEHNGWVWFTTSVWGVAGSDLNKGLCRLARPALQFTTSDGSCWYLTVHGGPHGPELFLHQFGYFSFAADPAHDAEQAKQARMNQPAPIDPELVFLEDEPEAPARPRTPFDYVADDFADSGTPLPRELYEQLRDLSYSQAVNRLRDWHAEAVPGAMARATIPVDLQAVRRALLWENVSSSASGRAKESNRYCLTIG